MFTKIYKSIFKTILPFSIIWLLYDEEIRMPTSITSTESKSIIVYFTYNIIYGKKITSIKRTVII